MDWEMREKCLFSGKEELVFVEYVLKCFILFFNIFILLIVRNIIRKKVKLLQETNTTLKDNNESSVFCFYLFSLFSFFNIPSLFADGNGTCFQFHL